MKRKNANNIEMFDVDAQLDAVFGKEGSPERAMAEERANAFFKGQIIEDARKLGLHCGADSCCIIGFTAKIS